MSTLLGYSQWYVKMNSLKIESTISPLLSLLGSRCRMWVWGGWSGFMPEEPDPAGVDSIGCPLPWATPVPSCVSVVPVAARFLCSFHKGPKAGVCHDLFSIVLQSTLSFWFLQSCWLGPSSLCLPILIVYFFCQKYKTVRIVVLKDLFFQLSVCAFI